MSTSRLSTLSPPDLKHRIITCLNRLSDRDTLAIATAELHSIIRTLTPDSFSCFINCVHNTDSSSKSAVRKQCVNLLAILSQSHGDDLSPFLSKMISTVIRRLRDPESAVRSACVAATAAMALNINAPPFSAYLKPLMETMTIEQDLNSQMGAALCLTAAIEAVPEVDREQLQKVLPRLGKLAKKEGFKAKAALLTLIGTVVSIGRDLNQVVLEWLIPCVVEFLSNEDWAVRKVSSEALGKIAVAEKNLAKEHKVFCLASLENRRFDKVKIVRETMNRTLELWKEVPGVSQDVSVPSQSKSSSAAGFLSPLSKSSKDVGLVAPWQKKTVPTSRSPPSDSSYPTTANIVKNNDMKSSIGMLDMMDHNKPHDQGHENLLPHPSSFNVACENYVRIRESSILELRKNHRSSRPETKHVLIHTQPPKHNDLKNGSRVVPVLDDENPESEAIVCKTSYEIHEKTKEFETLSLIREQLLQIENQQCNLFNLLQRYIGSSQCGMKSLEARVHALEMALNQISCDLAVSSGEVPNTNSAQDACCKLPVAEFFSPGFWRKTECSGCRN